MTDYIWPSQLVPNSSEWRLVANTASFVSPLSGTTRTLSRGGDRWACTFTFNNLTDDNRAILQALLAQLRGQANRVYVRDHSHVRRGVFATSNLLPDFSSTTPWTVSHSTLTVADGSARVTAATHTGVQYPSISKASLTVLNAGAYAVRGFYTRSSTGTANLGPSVTDGTTTTGSLSTAVGLKTATQVMTGTSASAILYLDATGTSTVANDYADIAYASVGRCLRVSGGSQTGSSILLEGTSAAGDMLAGDLLEINGEFNMAVAPLDGASGSGKVQLARPLRTSPASLAPVIVHDPLCKMMLSDQTVGWSNVPGGFSSFSVSFIEDIA
jgi:hypothetical protein